MLSTLLAAHDPEARELAWEKFLETYSCVLLRSAYHLARSYDGAMDRYAFILDQLRRGDFHRLRQFQATSSFSTWLAVVARRLCLDHGRRLYGRYRAGRSETYMATYRARRRLADLLGEPLEIGDLPDALPSDPESELAEMEQRSALDAVLAGLDARGRLLLKLRFGHDLTAREIARLMDFPSQFHVFRRLKTLLGRIRRELQEVGVDGSGR